MEICDVKHRSDLFTVLNKSKSFITEASTLEANNPRGAFGRVWNDACDEGLVIVSNKTGHEAMFAMNKTVYQDGELKVWELLPTRETLRKLPQLEGWKVIVHND